MYMLGPVYTAMATLHLNVGSSYNWVLHILIGTLCICRVKADIIIKHRAPNSILIPILSLKGPLIKCGDVIATCGLIQKGLASAK